MDNAQLYEQYRLLSKPDSGYFECQLPILRETEKAICFDASRKDLGKPVPVWIPKSQTVVVEFGNAASQEGDRYFIKNWLSKSLT